MKCKSYMKNEDVPENKEIFVYGFRLVKTDELDNYMLFGCKLDEIFEYDKLFNFWSVKFINKEIEMRNFKKTGCPFMTLVKRNNFLKVQSICLCYINVVYEK